MEGLEAEQSWQSRYDLWFHAEISVLSALVWPDMALKLKRNVKFWQLWEKYEFFIKYRPVVTKFRTGVFWIPNRSKYDFFRSGWQIWVVLALPDPHGFRKMGSRLNQLLHFLHSTQFHCVYLHIGQHQHQPCISSPISFTCTVKLLLQVWRATVPRGNCP